MIDNFELIKPLFYFNKTNNMFFHCQIVQRAKDHKPHKVKEGAIQTYENIVQNPIKILNSSAGKVKSRNPLWIVDIDDISIRDSIEEFLSGLYIEQRQFFRIEIPTYQGIHLLVPPFNLKLFQSEFPNIDVHKNSMGTLLYYPNSLSN